MRALGLALGLCAGLLSAQAPAPADRAAREAAAVQQLEALKRRVAALAAEQREAEAAQGQAATALRAADEALADAAGDADAAATALAAAEADLAAREQERAALATRLAGQRERLAALVRAGHRHGRDEPLRLLLGQQDLAASARALAYHRYVVRGREQAVRGLLDELQALARATAEVASRREEAARRATAASVAAQALAEERAGHAATLAMIDAGLADRRRRLAALGKDEQALQALLADLRDAIADVPRQLDDDRPFVSRRGRLAAPVQGQLQRRFGQASGGGLSSEGQFWRAERGAAVRAVAPGRVVYADWLKGHGLLLILDHGGGWMSLYAQQERLSREVGDWVRGGDVLGRAGNSGGERDPGLYFELRRDGQPVDPRGWFGR